MDIVGLILDILLILLVGVALIFAIKSDFIRKGLIEALQKENESLKIRIFADNENIQQRIEKLDEIKKKAESHQEKVLKLEKEYNTFEKKYNEALKLIAEQSSEINRLGKEKQKKGFSISDIIPDIADLSEKEEIPESLTGLLDSETNPFEFIKDGKDGFPPIETSEDFETAQRVLLLITCYPKFWMDHYDKEIYDKGVKEVKDKLKQYQDKN